MRTRVRKGLLYGFMGLLMGISSLPGQVSADSSSPEIVWQKEAGDEQIQLTGILESSNHQLSIGGLNGVRSGYADQGYQAFLSRWDDQGNLTWSRNITLDNPIGDKPVIISDVTPTKDGGYLIYGEYQSFFYRYNQVFLAKADRNGEVLWAKNFSMGSFKGLSSVVEGADGSLVFATTLSYAGQVHFIPSQVGRMNASSGQIEWTNKSSEDSGFAGDFAATNADVTPEGDIIVSGNIEGAVKLWKLSQSGELLWSKPLQLPGQVKAVNDGYLVISPPNYYGATQIEILKLDKAGNKQWRLPYDIGKVNQVTENEDGYLLAAARGLFQIDASGKLLWSKDLGKKVAKSIQIGSQDIYAVAGNKLVKLVAANSGGSDNPGDPVSSIKFDSEEYSISRGDTFDTVVTWYDQNGQAVNVSSSATYSSSRPDVLTIDAHGNITAISRGTAVITAKYGNQTVSALVNVY
ncbi:PQQ-binding-like beta-propeller repeat protein [Paenibacillus zeisoli]|nr:PQQ-binding-like beta-propeller repeat protein [Paenibacillus zeisoli]